MRKISKIIIIIIFSLFYKTYLNAEVVYLDLDKVMKKSAAGKSLSEYINAEQKKILEEFKTTENNFKDEEKKILAKKNILKKDEMEKKIRKLQDDVSLYNTNKKKVLQNLQKKKIDMTKQIIDNLNPILTSYMEENSVSLIIRKKDIIIGKNSLNITDNIILLLDKKITKIKNN